MLYSPREDLVQQALPWQSLASCLLLFPERRGGREVRACIWGQGLTRKLSALLHTGFALLDCVGPVILIHPLRVSY